MNNYPAIHTTQLKAALAQTAGALPHQPWSEAFSAALKQLGEQATTSSAVLAEQAASVIRELNVAAPNADRPHDETKVKLSSPFVGGVGPCEVLSTLSEIGGHIAANPRLLVVETGRYLQQISRAFTGQAPVEPPKGDRRFADDAWHQSPFHQLTLHNYLAWSTALNRLINSTGAGPEATERMRYVSSLFTDALSPANSLAGNPVALRKAVETGGASLVEGMRNMLKDLAENDGTPSQVDKRAFSVGKTVAATPGAVVFKNEVLELIQYTPSGEAVFSRPTLMIPPVVNKYYLLDLAPGRSTVEYLVEHGFQTFMVSWRNPTAADASWSLDTYVEALVEAVEAIAEITGSPTLNLFTVCTGAVPMTALMGYLAAKGDDRVASATMVVSVLDSNQGRSLGLFATPEAIAKAKRRSQANGVLDGKEMARTFTWMRPKDLVWNYWVNNYLLGKQPPAHDILFWNNDPTRLPAALHAQLLDIFADDLLAKPGGLQVLGQSIDLGRVTCDIYMVGGMTDHISIWKGSYASARLFGGNFEFVLHSSGHIQTVVNPPGTPKTRYFTNAECPDEADHWLAGAGSVSGSWWEHWKEWLSRRSGSTVAVAAELGSAIHPAAAQAPGAYVKVR